MRQGVLVVEGERERRPCRRRDRRLDPLGVLGGEDRVGVDRRGAARRCAGPREPGRARRDRRSGAASPEFGRRFDDSTNAATTITASAANVALGHDGLPPASRWPVTSASSVATYSWRASQSQPSSVMTMAMNPRISAQPPRMSPATRIVIARRDEQRPERRRRDVDAFGRMSGRRREGPHDQGGPAVVGACRVVASAVLNASFSAAPRSCCSCPTRTAPCRCSTRRRSIRWQRWIGR